MKAVALILCFRLLLVNFLPSQDIHELSGVAQLIEHYHEHEDQQHANHDEINFFEFLSMHYADEYHKNSPGHENLPFHHIHPSQVVTYFVTPFTSIAFTVNHYSLHTAKPKFFFEPRMIFWLVYSIWQPPKF